MTSHINLEGNRTRRMRLHQDRHSVLTQTISGTFVIPAEAPTYHFINGGLSTRTVFLPAYTPEGGSTYVISNIGTTNTLNIVDANGVAVASITHGSTAQFVEGKNRWAAVGASAAGGVTSVDFAAPAIFSVSGNPIINSGTITLSLATQTQNKIWASPNGSTGAPTFRALVAADLPSVPLTTGVTGTLPETNGGTGQSTITQGDLLYGSAANTISKLAKNASSTRYLANTGASNSPAWAQVDLSNGVTGALPETNGGTGQSTITQGDLLFGSAANTISKLAKSASATRYLANTGTSNNPAWAQVDLSNGVTGNLPVANLGSGGGTPSATTFLCGNNTWAIPSSTLTVGTSAITSGTTRRLLYDNGGNLGETTNIYSDGTFFSLGDSTQRSFGATSATWQLNGTSSGAVQMGIGGYSASSGNATPNNAGQFCFYRSTSGSIGTATVVLAEDLLGSIRFLAAQQSGTLATQTEAARIMAVVDGTVTSGAGADMPGRLVFMTTPDGSGTVTERMRIDNQGNVVVGTAALNTTATDGFLYIPTCAGAPTGNSTDYSGMLPIVYDSTNNKLYINTSGTTWKGVTLA